MNDENLALTTRIIQPTSINGIPLSNFELGKTIGMMPSGPLSQVLLGMLLGLARQHEAQRDKRLADLLWWAFFHARSLYFCFATEHTASQPEMIAYPGTGDTLPEFGEQIISLQHNQTLEAIHGLREGIESKREEINDQGSKEYQRHTMACIYAELLRAKLGSIAAYRNCSIASQG